MSLLDYSRGELVVAAPGQGDGYWAGGPSALHTDGRYYLAYRLRRPVEEGRGYANVVASSSDGVHFETLCVLDKDALDTASLERPALVRRPDGGWRIYVSLSTRGSKHWRVVALDADRPEDLAAASPRPVWPGDERTAVKDPVVVLGPDERWHAWLCLHPLDVIGHEDRMTTAYVTSTDGIDWTEPRTVLAPDGDGWDARGRRLATVLAQPDGSVLALYDGRADAAQNWYERTGTARARMMDGSFEVDRDATVMSSPFGRSTLRYASAALGPDATLVYYEAAGPDGANEIRVERLSPSTGR